MLSAKVCVVVGVVVVGAAGVQAVLAERAVSDEAGPDRGQCRA
jgi:hypothetical protein